MRLELTTYSMASCRSSQLSYTRIRFFGWQKREGHALGWGGEIWEAGGGCQTLNLGLGGGVEGLHKM